MNYRVPLHTAVTQVIMLGGVPREIAILNGTLGSALVLGLHSLWGLPVSIVIHIFCLQAAKRDEQFFYTFRRSLRFNGFYEG